MTATPSFPNFAGKHGHESVISPSESIRHLLDDAGRPRVPVPAAAILTYQRSILRSLAVREHARLADGYPATWGRVHLVERPSATIAVVGGFGIGAPAAAAVLEELVALGIPRFLSIGAAGTLQPDAAFGDVVLCTSAIRDEGVSHHYLPTEKFAYPSDALTSRLGAELAGRGIPYRCGPTWTIDTPYRETVAEARSYQAEGIVTVEMEAAALFAVATYRGVQIASAFVVTDTLAEVQWTHAFGTREVVAALEALLDAAIDAVDERTLP